MPHECQKCDEMKMSNRGEGGVYRIGGFAEIPEVLCDEYKFLTMELSFQRTGAGFMPAPVLACGIKKREMHFGVLSMGHRQEVRFSRRWPLMLIFQLMLRFFF